MFGIIAGVLIGVWAMYTMLAEETDVKAAVAEIQLIREAAVQFKHNDGGGKYNGMTLATFGSYLGDGVAQDMDIAPYGVILTNTFGGSLSLFSDRYGFNGTDGGNLLLTSDGIPNLNICRQILEHFGEIQMIASTLEGGGDPTTTYYIPIGKSIFGYVGSPDENGSGCSPGGYYGTTLQLRID